MENKDNKEKYYKIKLNQNDGNDVTLYEEYNTADEAIRAAELYFAKHPEYVNAKIYIVERRFAGITVMNKRVEGVL